MLGRGGKRMKGRIVQSSDWAEYVTGLLSSHQRMLGRLTREINILWILNLLQALVVMYLLWRV